MIITEQFKKCFPNNTQPDAWCAALNSAMDKYSINNVLRIAAFLAQCGHESNGFTVTMENLNYSAQALANTWPKRYAVDPKAKVKTPNQLALSLHRKPQAIANNVYANRMGNGDEASGDGWRYRGTGPIQTTGHDNHMAFVAASGQPFGYILTIEGGAESAAWFWDRERLNPLADNQDMLAITKRINGGTNGLEDRMARYAAIRKLLS